MSQASAYEQYFIELINWERAQTGAQPLAFNSRLNDAAELHSQWMINTDTFSHTGVNNSDPGQRMTLAGYSFTGNWTWGENIAWASLRGAPGYQDEVELLHTNLMNSPGHKANILNGNFKEIGLGFEVGQYGSWQGAFITQDFAKSGTATFLTGVAFDDKDGDHFYDPGEGMSGLTVTAVSTGGASYSTTTELAGGYQMALPSGAYTVTFSGATIANDIRQVTIGSSNVKADLIDPSPPAPEPPTPPPVSSSTDSSRDFNADSAGDVLFQVSDGRAALWEMNGLAPIYGAVVGPNPGSTWHIKDGGDFNGDGKADILWQTDTGRAAIWLMNGVNPIAGDMVGPNPGTSWHVIGGGDFNGDGKSDILWQTDSGQAAIWLMNGTTVLGGSLVGPNPGSSWHVKGAGDFNGDGKADILWQTNTGQVAIWLMNGLSVTYGKHSGPNPGASWHIKGIGDFNGDQKDDFVFQLDDGRTAIWLMNGADPIHGDMVGPNQGTGWHVRDAVDLDADGKADVLWQSDAGQVAGWLMDGTDILSGNVIGPNPGAGWHVLDGAA